MIKDFFYKNEFSGTSAYLGDFVIHYDATKVDMVVMQDFLSDPDHLIDSGGKIRSIWENKAIDKSLVEVGSEMVFVKRYNCLGEIYRIKNMFRRSKACKAWRAGRRLLQSGIPTPRPIICIEERRFRLLGRSYLLCEYIHDAHTLLDAWPVLDDQKRVRFLYLAGIEIGIMHHMGFLHGDLNWRNVLIQEMPDCAKIYLVDLDGCRYLKHIDGKAVSRDLNHFYRDFERNNTPPQYIEQFTESWHQAFLQGKQ